MACVHNQAKIDQLIAQIRQKQAEINSLKNNITKCNEIKTKHINFNTKLDCVIANLEGNHVVAGQAYDKGMMSECLDNSNKTIKDCDDIVLASNSKISSLEREILSLESMIASLQGDCEACIVIDDDLKTK